MIRRLLDLPALRTHVHLTVHLPATPDSWSDVFDLVADAAHDLDEELMCSGCLNLPDRVTAQVDILGYRMGRRQAEALQTRVEAALVGRVDNPAYLHLTRRCRCTGEEDG